MFARIGITRAINRHVERVFDPSRLSTSHLDLDAISRKGFRQQRGRWWGFHYKDLLTEPKPREVVTIYEVDAIGERNWAKAVYNFRWTPQTDPSGVVRKRSTILAFQSITPRSRRTTAS
jgi:hypothetical protein